jgi:hypothetical protein
MSRTTSINRPSDRNRQTDLWGVSGLPHRRIPHFPCILVYQVAIVRSKKLMCLFRTVIDVSDVTLQTDLAVIQPFSPSLPARIDHAFLPNQEIDVVTSASLTVATKGTRERGSFVDTLSILQRLTSTPDPNLILFEIFDITMGVPKFSSALARPQVYLNNQLSNHGMVALKPARPRLLYISLRVQD